MDSKIVPLHLGNQTIFFSFNFLTEEKKDQYPIPVLFQQQMLQHCYSPLCNSFAKTFQLPGFPFPLYEGRLHTIEESCLLYWLGIRYHTK